MPQTEFFIILDHFLPFYPHNNPKKSKFEKIKKALGDIIILHMCIINDNHMMHGSSDTEHDRQNFLFWTIFCTFIPVTNWKTKILKNENTTWRYYHFIQVYHKWNSYDVWFLRYGVCDRQKTVLGTFTPLTTWQIKVLNKFKKHLEILSFYICVP